MSVEDFHKELIFSMKELTKNSSLWNVMPIKAILKQWMLDVIERTKQNNQTKTIPLDINETGDWKFIFNLFQLFRKSMNGDIFRFEFTQVFKEGDWTTKSVGNFFIKNLEIFKTRCDFDSELMSKLDQMFILPKQNISLPHIAFMYAANNFRTYYSKIGLVGNFDDHSSFTKTLKNCIQDVLSSEEYGIEMEMKEFFDEKLEPPPRNRRPFSSPCLNASRYAKCNVYCNWHKTYFNDWPKEDFITLMRYAMPQRKMNMSRTTPSEKKLAVGLFGNGATGALNYTIAPYSLILFCYQRSKGFEGDDLGIYAKVCNKFFPTPTDQGICLTRNMNIKELMNTDEKYDQLFESDLRKDYDKFVEGGTYGSKNTLAFSSGYKQTMLFENNKDREDSQKFYHPRITLKLHQSNEIPHFFEDDSFQLSSTSLRLEPGVEYIVDVIPQVTKTTQAFKKMNFQQRKCKLKHEIGKKSIFKVYTQKNCEYECKIKNAEAMCKCIPWDFLHQNTLAANDKECDIFGRTCFFNAMKNYKSRSLCNHCVKECDYTIYDVIIKKEKSLETNSWGNSYSSLATTDGDKCYGQSIFCEYFWPFEYTNKTAFIDEGSRHSFNGLSQGPSFKGQYFNKVLDVVIVHWRILKPEVNVVDAKYSILDKFANFGGNFGIFAEITGCSFLGIMNFLILLFKLTVSKYYA